MSISYYAAANTEKGFKSLFGEIFSPKELSRLYIIKGGPGTGKSTFMRGVAKAAEQRGFDVEYYYCSADTGSLDGVKIPSLKTALIDGTSPHSYEPRYPGACETVIDLGQNFDTGKLRENRRGRRSACFLRYRKELLTRIKRKKLYRAFSGKQSPNRENIRSGIFPPSGHAAWRI